MKPVKYLFIAAIISTCSISAQAQLLYREGFENTSVGSRPTGWSSTQTQDDKGNWGVTDQIGSNSFRSLSIIDNDGSGTGYKSVVYDLAAFTSLNTAEEINFKFDLRVDKYQGLTAGAQGTVRVALQADGVPANQYAIGLGYATVNGTNTLFFYSGAASAPVPGASNAIGYTPGTGFAPGFNLGAMGAGITNGTGGVFYNFDLTFNNITKSITLTVTNLANPSQTFTYNDTWNVASLSTNGKIVATTGSVSKGEVYLDNVELSVIPEPSSIALAGGACLLLGALRLHARHK